MMKSDKRRTNYLSVIVMMLALSTQLSAQSGACDTDYTLNFSDAGNEWHVNDVSGSYTVGEQTFGIAIDDDDHILESTNESNEGLEIRIDPHDRDDVLTITYTLSETANHVSFPIVDLDKKSGGSDQQEQVCVLGYLGNNPIPIMPTITTLDGSVDISGNCATATTNSATSGQDESVLVEFDECIDRVVIVYGSGPMAPHDPTSSKIYIGEGSGFTSNVCNTCDENCTSENVLNFTDSGIDWAHEAITGTYTVGTQTYTINLVDDDGILETNAEDGPFSKEFGEGIKIGINPNSNEDNVTACYALSEVSNKVYFKIRDLDKKMSGSDQQEQVCVYGTLGDDPTIISPTITSLDGSVAISQEADGSVCATGTTNSAISHQEESVFVEFDECIDKIFIVYGSGPMAPDDPTYSSIYIGEEFGFYTGVCGEECTVTCDAEAGTLTLNGDDNVCITDGSEVSASPNGDAIIPNGYQALFLLTQGNDLVIVDVGPAPVFFIPESGEYTIHTLVYDPSTLDLSGVVEGVTTGFEVYAMLIEGGGDVCASLDVTGARFMAEVLNTGILTPVVSNFCSIGSAVDFMLMATPDGGATIPAGYELIYVLTSGEGLLIEDVGTTPEFMVSGTGIYTIHTLIYDPNTLDLDDVNITTGLDVNAALAQGGGEACGALDVMGAEFIIDNPDAGQIAPGITGAICTNGGLDVPLEGIPDGTALVPPGYQLIYVLTSGDELLIQDVSTVLPQFTVEVDDLGNGNGIYTIHTLVYNPGTLDLSGVTTGFEVNSSLVQGNGDICGALDVGGARFELATCAAAIDNDLDDDGISNIQEGNGVDPSADDDGDGIANYEDPDFPGFTDDNNDGINDGFDKDLDGIADIFDLDSDNDGVADIIEAGGQDTNGDGLVDSFVDDDNDGWADAYDNDDDTTPELNDGAGTPLPHEDSDGDGLPNSIDLDSDSDGVADIIEAGGMDSNGDGYIDNTADVDGDGYADLVDTDNNEIEGPNDGGTALPSPDSDGDGRIDALDLDSDNDGVADLTEAGGQDTNGDGQLDIILDADGDGLANLVDTDNNEIEGPNDGGTALLSNDTDGDGVRNAIDRDSDNDGVADIVEAGGQDTNGDGVIDDTTDTDSDGYADLVDTDNNSIEGSNDGGTALPNPDSDNDGSVDALDLDSDNDGLSDLSEADGKDTDGNGQLDVILDADGDGYADLVDTDNNNMEGPNDGGTALLNPDLDGDGLIDRIDLDSDNDGLSDLSESIGDPILVALVDPNGNGTVSGMDMDKDGIVDGTFDDDMDLFGGSLTIAMDSDGDLLPNHLDIDADGDNIIDLAEGQMTFGYFTPLEGANADIDGDGINDAFDSNIGTRGGFLITAIDTDSDGIPDYLDLNSDNDDEPDSVEGFDYDGNGEPEAPNAGMPGDPDNDGLDGEYDLEENVYDPTNDEYYADELADADGGTPEVDFRSAFSINIIVNLSGAMLDPMGGNTYEGEMRSTLKTRGLLPGQTLVGLGTPTPAGQPYNIAPWNYTGTEGAGWTDAEYDEIAALYGRRVVDWVLVSFRRTFMANSLIERHAGLVLEDGRVVFPRIIDLSGEEELYIVVEHRNHMAAMTPSPVTVDGRIFYNFTLADSYIGPDPDNPLGAGQLEVIPGVFALYNSDGEQVLDAGQAANPSYNITGADKTVWQSQNGVFSVYQAADYNMNGDTNGADLIPFEVYNGVFSVVPR